MNMPLYFQNKYKHYQKTKNIFILIGMIILPFLAFSFFFSLSENLSIASLSAILTVSTDETNLTIVHTLFFIF